MSVNFVDYEVLQNGISVYGRESESILSILDVLNNMNTELSEGWQNETARAFVEKFNEVHAPAMKNVAEALAEISQLINQYMANKQEEDSAGAAAIRG